MSDRESMLSFLENFNQEDEDVNTQQVEEEDVETPAADSASMLQFLGGASSTTEVEVDDTTPAPVATTVDEETLDFLTPRAEDPDDPYVAPTYEYEKGERLTDVRADIADMDEYLAGMNDQERKEFEDLVAESIASGNAMRDPNFVDVAMSKLPTDWLLGMGNFFQKAGAVTTDGMEAAFSSLYDKSPTAFAGLTSAITFGKGYGIKNPADLADFIADGAGAASEFLETIPALGNIQGAINTAVTSGAKTASAGLSRQAIREAKMTAQAQRNNPEGARLATMLNADEARSRASSVAAKNRDIADDLILEFEATTGKTVSVQDGSNLRIDPDLSRQAGVETATEITERDGALFDLNLGDDMITTPILKPEKFDGIVSIAADFKSKFPDDWNPEKPVIENLYELTINKQLMAPQELLDDLNNYGLSFEDYVLTVAGSGSQAGKVLNKLSQLGRMKPKSIIDSDAAKKAAEDSGKFRKFVMRVENIRRGGLVSQVATAARNLASGGIRAPMEALGNVMDDAIFEAADAGVMSGAKRLFSRENWNDSFSGMRYMFSRPDLAQGYGDLILEQPEMAKQFDAMYNNINEIQALTGRGTGTAVDKVMSGAEDVVDLLNTPNRWQEYLIRRGQYFGELERLVNRHYKIDLVDTLNAGKVKDLLNDASSVKPENAPSFTALVDEAVTKALDVTYAKQPEIPVFRSTSQFIVRNGLTVAIPFPRFMFNSMELMGQYAGGASIPLTRKMASVVTGGRVGGGPLTAKDRQRITRNMMGMAAVGAGYYMRTAEDAPADFEQISVGEDAQMDTTAVYPMAQFLYLGEMTKRKIKGTFEERFDAQEFVELFTGSNFRTGVGNSMLEEVAQIADATDLTSGEAAGRMIGRTVGNWLGTWAVPLGQIIDAERATGVRGTEFKDVSSDPTLSFGGTLGKEVTRSLKQRGLGVTPEEEAAAPRQEYPFYSEGKERLYPWMKFGGFTITSKPDEDGEYLKRLGFNWKDFGSRSKVPSIKRFEQSMINGHMETLTEIAQDQEVRLRSEYMESNERVKDNFTEDEFVSNKLRPLISSKLRSFKALIRDGALAQGDSYAKAMTKYRRVTPEYRRLATTDFVDRYGEAPDPLNSEDLQKLIAIAGAYRDAYK
jgi:hypothetical protein